MLIPLIKINHLKFPFWPISQDHIATAKNGPIWMGDSPKRVDLGLLKEDPPPFVFFHIGH